MSDDLPPLPDTRDPFELLGVSRDDDERAIKRAYARLIKVYRPDRSPDEFARIHDAFELVRMHATVEPASAPVMEPRPSVEEAHAEPTPPPDALDPDEVACSLMAGFEARLENGEIDELRRELADPRLRADAEDQPWVALPVLRAIAALAWRDVEVGTLRKRYSDLPRELGLERVLDRVDHEVALATAVKRTFGTLLPRRPGAEVYSTNVPRPIATLFADSTVMSRRRRAALLEEVRGLLREPLALLALGDRLGRQSPELCGLLIDRLKEQTAVDDDRPLAGPVADALVRLADRLRWPVSEKVLIGGTVIGGAGLFVSKIPVVMAVSLVVLVPFLGALAVLALRDSDRFVRQVRPEIARMIAEHGVQTVEIRRWLVANRDRFGRLARYDVPIGHDGGLGFLAALATLARSGDGQDGSPRPS